jgi:very-short-patch-repair endonuclease
MSSSNLEELFSYYVRVAGLPTPEREIRPIPSRHWRIDFAWPEHLLAVEIEGGTWVAGRHSRGAGFAKDCEKYNALQMAGWTVLRFTGDQVESGMAVDTASKALASLREDQSENDMAQSKRACGG